MSLVMVFGLKALAADGATYPDAQRVHIAKDALNNEGQTRLWPGRPFLETRPLALLPTSL
jgi:hypothetical protein